MRRKQIWIDPDFDLAIEEFRKRVGGELGCEISKTRAMEIIGKSLLRSGLINNGIKITELKKSKERGKFKARFDVEL